MQRFISLQSVAAAGLALGALGAASVAHARSEVYFSIGVQPATVYTQPEPVYVYPAPAYVQPRPAYVAPRPSYEYTPSYRDRYQPSYQGGYQPSYHGQYQDGYQQHYQHRYYDRGYRQQRRYERLYGPYGDLDRDGIRNQYDRDRDGDGVRNRFDRAPDDGYRY